PFTAMYQQLAQKNDLPLVPFLLDGIATNSALMQPDGLHPNAEGEPWVLDNVWAVVAPLWGGLPATPTPTLPHKGGGS
ncbi:MAG: hypothetical protein ACP5Q0_02620, partial [Halothiobacillus sp.]